MARRRYITTATATDKRLNDIAKQSDFVALFYFMMIPHVGDDCMLPAEPEELLGTVLPLRRDKDVEDVTAALTILHGQRLLKWCKRRRLIMFPPSTFYRIQAYIRADRRISQEVYDNFCTEDGDCEPLAHFANLRQSSAESVALASASASITTTIPPTTSATAAPNRGTSEAAAYSRDVSWEAGTSMGTPYVKTLKDKGYSESEIRQVIDEYNRKPEPPPIRGSIANFLAGMIERNRKNGSRASPQEGTALSLADNAERIHALRQRRGLTQ